MENLTEFLNDYECEGTELEILTIPNPILKKKSVPVEKFDQELAEFCKNMLYTMYHAPGIGLAAPQVGRNLRIFVIDIDYEKETVNKSDDVEEFNLFNFNPQIFINPVLKDLEGEIVFEEGCLSVPGVYEPIKRAQKLVLEYQDLNGEKHTLNAEDTLAVCIQHENDHLDGKIFIERLSLLKRNLITKKFIKQKKRQ